MALATTAKRIVREVTWEECKRVLANFTPVREAEGTPPATVDFIYRGQAIIDGVSDDWFIRVSPLPGARARMVFVPSSCNC